MAGGLGEDDDKVRQGTAPESRAKIAARIDRLRDTDIQAIEHLESALAQ